MHMWWTLEVYQNLASAFRHLRHIDQVRTFWVDAICINQGDIAERNKQVKRMANIYKLAYRVVAWLGKEEHNSTQALATLQYIGEQVELTKRGRLVRAPGAVEPNLWMNACCFSCDDPIQTWQALLGILSVRGSIDSGAGKKSTSAAGRLFYNVAMTKYNGLYSNEQSSPSTTRRGCLR
jgi:Heterokaryon incompatibility protein (HET)